MKSVINLPIGVIDSGIGGLAMLKELSKKYSSENYIYLADNAYMPYGNKSASFIKARLLELVNYLVDEFNVKLVILACNTASITALEYLNKHSPVQVLGLDLNDLAVGDYKIICTKQSSKGYKHLNTYACNTLASVIEDNIFDKPNLKRKLKTIMKKASINESNIILGCTHYELVSNVFSKEFADKNFVLPCKEFVSKLKLNSHSENGSVIMLATLSTKAYIDKLWKIFKD